MDAWRVEVGLRPGLPDPEGRQAKEALRRVGLELRGEVRHRRGFLLGADLPEEDLRWFAREVVADPVTDEVTIWPPGAAAHFSTPRVCVVPLPGVTDPVAGSVARLLADCALPAVPTGTYRVYELDPLDSATAAEDLARAARRELANEVIQQVLVGTLPPGLPGAGPPPDLDVHPIAVRHLDDPALRRLSQDAGLALDTTEMRAIREHFAAAGREPTRLELETLAQTWSEHCKHKTLTARFSFEGRTIDNLLGETIAHVTHTLRRSFCVSVFDDNAGIVDFDGEDCLCIKVETHNHPSAIEPFGGAGTGVGGVIRDILGTGLGARPVANLDVFCLAPPDLTDAELPRGCRHPLQLLRGVVAGVRDYGNPMGIPTVTGAVHFDPDFVGNPLVYVGTVGLLPREKAFKKPRNGDLIVVVGGRTGRDGIHGATFSSLELHSQSEEVSRGAVQIGDPITERKTMDVILRARDEGLFRAITDCGAGGFSSAVGEMADGLGAEVDLSRVPLKDRSLAPWEIWLSESQERMVLAVPPEHLDRLMQICSEEDVEAAAIGAFTTSGRLCVRHGDTAHGDLDLEFLHRGLPRRELNARYEAPRLHDPELPPEEDCTAALHRILADPNVASKEWIIRQYDHEVQAGGAGKPLVGVRADGPADAAVVAPKLGSNRGFVLATGLNPRYSRIDPAAMAECALDEALRNVVAVGGDPDRTAVLDNYCWASSADPRRLGELVRASRALHDLALAYGTPFVSGKDSLNNEFRDGDRIFSIPGCILITALSVIPDVMGTIGSDLSAPGHRLVVVGETRAELGGSVYWKSYGELGASVPRVDAARGKRTLEAVWRAIQARAVVSAHDASEGGLGAALAEMAIGGRLGIRVELDRVPRQDGLERAEHVLFSESQSRFVLEVPPDRMADVAANLRGVPWADVGVVTESPHVVCLQRGRPVVSAHVEDLARSFRSTLDLDGAMTGGER